MNHAARITELVDEVRRLTLAHHRSERRNAHLRRENASLRTELFRLTGGQTSSLPIIADDLRQVAEKAGGN